MSVGKTSIMQQYVFQKPFNPNSISTIGVEFTTKSITLQDGTRVKCQIWDSGGQERYKAMTANHFKRAVGALLVFDITKRETFEELGKWIQMV